MQAFANIYKNLRVPHLIASDVDELRLASKLILPGVGAFDQAMIQLQESGMRERLDSLVLEDRIPVLGVCVGMQMMASASEEGRLPGLGWIDGVVERLDVSHMQHQTQLPHLGWNTVKPCRENALFEGLDGEPSFYFLHSYHVLCRRDVDVIGVTEYGGTFVSAINSDAVYGIQCHPEKSHQQGIQLLANYAAV